MFKTISFKPSIFLGWFVIMILWLPTSIGGWLVHFNIISMDNMWSASLGLSVVVALFSSCGVRRIAEN